jgi:hypothetical protein
MKRSDLWRRLRTRLASARASLLRSLVTLPIRRGIKGYAPPARARREIHDVPTTPLMSDAEWTEFMAAPPEKKSEVMERFLAKHRCGT